MISLADNASLFSLSVGRCQTKVSGVFELVWLEAELAVLDEAGVEVSWLLFPPPPPPPPQQVNKSAQAKRAAWRDNLGDMETSNY